MYKPIYIFIGLRYLWNPCLPFFKKIITILSIISISISICSIIIITSIINGCQNDFKKNILSFIPHTIVTNKNKKINKLNFSKNILKSNNIEKITDITNATMIVQNKNEVGIAEVIGISENNYTFFKNYNAKDSIYKLFSKENNIIIGKKLAENLHININDTIQLIRLPTNKKEFFMNSFLGQSFKIISFFSTNNEIDSYQILINRIHIVNFLNYSKNDISGWRIWLKDPFYLNTIKILKKNFITLDWKTQKGELFKAIQMQNYIMWFLLILVLLISIFNIIINFSIHIINKKHAISILKSQGLSHWKIILIFITLGISTSIIGNVIGTIMSILLILQKNFLNNLINFFYDDIKISIIIFPIYIILINVFSIVLSIISTFFPAYYIVKSKSFKNLSNE